MFIPHTITNNSLAVYHVKYNKNSKRLLKSEDFTNWCIKYPKSLRKLCLDTIVLYWTEYPIINEIRLEDDARYVLDNLLPDLPFKLAVSHIHDELYWRRAFRTRWPGKMIPAKPQKLDYEIPNQCNRYANKSIHKDEKDIVKVNTWKCFYIERHLQDFLEHLKPEDYNAHEMKDLIELSTDYIIRLKLNQLQAPVEHNKERIPLNAILPALSNLKQLSMCFKQTYVGDEFSWHVLQTSHKDVQNLGIGLKACDLYILRIVNTDINCDNVIMLANSLLLNRHLRVLDFSHCKIGNKGITAICKLLLESTTCKEINLMNNFIETKGIEMLAYTLSKPTVKLSKLDLSLNNFGKTGADYLALTLCTNTELSRLILSACGLNNRNINLLIKSLETNKTY